MNAAATDAHTTSSVRGAGESERPTGDESHFHPLTLESLSVMSLETLESYFRRGSTPTTLEVMTGSSRGRLLGLTGLARHEPLASVFRHVSGSSLFPWLGKRFEATLPDRGYGVNRFAVLFGEVERFEFELRVEPSALDGRPCVCFDYDQATNPRLLRGLRDEVREVSPGLFMGPAFVGLGAALKPVLYFGVSLR